MLVSNRGKSKVFVQMKANKKELQSSVFDFYIPGTQNFTSV